MAKPKIVRCPACNQGVSRAAFACPGCGHPLRETRTERAADGGAQDVFAGLVGFFVLVPLLLGIGSVLGLCMCVGVAGTCGSTGSTTDRAVRGPDTPPAVHEESVTWSIDADASLGRLEVTAPAAPLYASNDEKGEPIATVRRGAVLHHFGKDAGGTFYRTTDSGRRAYIDVGAVEVVTE
jgi:hypothetical protein